MQSSGETFHVKFRKHHFSYNLQYFFRSLHSLEGRRQEADSSKWRWFAVCLLCNLSKRETCCISSAGWRVDIRIRGYSLIELGAQFLVIINHVRIDLCVSHLNYRRIFLRILYLGSPPRVFSLSAPTGGNLRQIAPQICVPIALLMLFHPFRMSPWHECREVCHWS